MVKTDGVEEKIFWCYISHLVVILAAHFHASFTFTRRVVLDFALSKVVVVVGGISCQLLHHSAPSVLYLFKLIFNKQNMHL